MLTLKQIEAFFWAARLSSFSRAAAKLCMTQSALSKRVSELEEELKIPLFDRSAYRPVLTDAGRAVLDTAERMLELREQMYSRTGADAAPAGLVSFGVTEVVAGTWLPRWVADMRRDYPHVTLEPYVDVSAALAARLRAGEIEMAVMPQQLPGPEFTAMRLAEVAFSMMAAPEVVPTGVLTREALARLPVFAQSGGSGLTEVFDSWARVNGLSMQRVLASNSLVAISELVLAGLGIALLPMDYYRAHLDSGRLRAVAGPLPWPRLPYYLITRTGPGSGPLRALQQVALRPDPQGGGVTMAPPPT
ncbi:LysR family transcriptional regulator [Bordetella sp. LUAb4]|uniref:LysR family transcriptional regulator n=1 Tax=Bordetella sp. LUAb4 TaxID=2843195 RepID=UPI001E4943E1|nr:LysR family transcriptional regulator [Bordetella sp. LUAb4]